MIHLRVKIIMGAESRLKKIAKAEVEKLGHDIGCFITSANKETCQAYCLKCNCEVSVYLGPVAKDCIIDTPNGNRINLTNKDDKVFNSGITVKDLFSKTTKGMIYGEALITMCNKTL